MNRKVSFSVLLIVAMLCLMNVWAQADEAPDTVSGNRTKLVLDDQRGTIKALDTVSDHHKWPKVDEATPLFTPQFGLTRIDIIPGTTASMPEAPFGDINAGTIGIDTNGDGKADTSASLLDLNNNGLADALVIDLDKLAACDILRPSGTATANFRLSDLKDKRVKDNDNMVKDKIVPGLYIDADSNGRPETLLVAIGDIAAD